MGVDGSWWYDDTIRYHRLLIYYYRFTSHRSIAYHWYHWGCYISKFGQCKEFWSPISWGTIAFWGSQVSWSFELTTTSTSWNCSLVAFQGYHAGNTNIQPLHAKPGAPSNTAQSTRFIPSYLRGLLSNIRCKFKQCSHSLPSHIQYPLNPGRVKYTTKLIGIHEHRSLQFLVWLAIAWLGK